MPSWLLFILGASAMISIVPLSILLATGSWRSAWEALRGYLLYLGAMVGLAGAGMLLYVIGSAVS